MGMLLFVTGCSSDDSGDSEPVAPDAPPQDFVFEKDEDDPDSWSRYYYLLEVNVSHDDYNHLNGIRIRYDANSSLLDFINKNTGANIQTQLWGCESEEYTSGRHRWLCCPCIELDNLDAQRSDYCTGPFVSVWK